MLHDHFRSPLAAPLLLHLPDGQPFHVSAQLESAASQRVSGSVRVESVTPHPVLLRQATRARADTPPDPGLQAFCTGDAQVEHLVHKVRRAIAHGIPLLLMGESGTGKQTLARAVHQDSDRAARPFVAVDCSALPASALAAELFGAEDSSPDRSEQTAAAGRIAQARGGTLFLDHIDALPLALQSRLLQALALPSQATSDSAWATPALVIAATQRRLGDLIGRQAFREDLYYRLSGLTLRLPPLRERSDLEALARGLLLAHRPADPPDISPPVLDLFRRYRWPGNVRQLAHVLRTAAVMSAGERSITAAHLSDDLLDDLRGTEVLVHAAPAEPTPARTLQESETELIRRTLQDLGGNVTAASRRLGISRNTIYRRLNWQVER
jgi:transcriptional regulator of acetoin/glycerol metabolism